MTLLSLGEELAEKLAYKVSFYIPLGDIRIPVDVYKRQSMFRARSAKESGTTERLWK